MTFLSLHSTPIHLHNRIANTKNCWQKYKRARNRKLASIFFTASAVYSQQRYKKETKQKGETLRFPPSVIPERFERSTHALEGRCSIQLSYGTIKSLRTAKIQVFLQSHKRN